MKRKKSHYSYSRAFQSYIISYTGVVLITLALLSIVSAWRISENMKAEAIRVTESKLYTITEDMENQLDSMRSMVLEVASLQEFRQDYFQQNKYYEVELLKRLKKYKRVSDISDYFFIRYKENPDIFTSEGTTMPLELYLSTQFLADSQEEATELIERMCVETKVPLAFFQGDGMMLFLYPLKKYAVSGIGMEGTLCFEVSERKLKERMEKIAGRIDGNLALYYGENLIYGQETEISGRCLERISNAGNFSVVFQPGESDYFLWSNVLSLKEGVVLGVILLLLLCVAFSAAYRSYQPIRKLAEKYKRAADGNLAEDLDSIDLLIDTLLRKEEKSSQVIQEQYQALKEQTIRLIVSGGYSSKLQERMVLLNLHLDTPVLGRIRCHFSDSPELEATYESMYRDIEDLSDDGIYLYSYWDEDNKLTVLAAVEEAYQMEEVTESLQSLFEAKNLTVNVELLGICHELTQINHMTPVDPVMPEEISETTEEAGYEKKKALVRQKSTAAQAVAYIEKNCTEYDLSLDLLAQEFHVTSTYLCRLIKQYTGVSYKEYLTELRIARAKEMLLDKSASVADVCQQVGYTNVSYFIKVFQKHTGVTPAKYRDEMRAGK